MTTGWLHAQPYTCNTATCPKVGDPSIGDCFAGIEKYIGRSIAMSGLAEQIAEVPWTAPCNNPAYACAYPDSCGGVGICPARYCQDIQLCVDLKAAMIKDVASVWVRSTQLQQGSMYLKAAKQAVIDINHAYDCAGLIRPIIGANILEYIDTDGKDIRIPSYVIAAFSNDPDFNPAIYNVNNPPFFNPVHITSNGAVAGTPDIDKIETRMWVYYCATTYIDLGYKTFSMDLVCWSLSDLHSDPTHEKTYRLLNMIRSYAQQAGSFVVFCGLHGYTYNGTTLFDYEGGPLWPDETTTSLTTACNGYLNTKIVDDSIAVPLHTISSGTMPLLGCYVDRIPFMMDVEFHTSNCGTPGVASPSDRTCSWGYDETTWFATLGEQCKSDYINYWYTLARSYYYRGFFIMPGRKLTNNHYFRLSEHPTAVDRIKNDIWKVGEMPQIASTTYCHETPVGLCGSPHDNPQVNKYYRHYKYTITNPDKSSIYTWHVQRPDGTWLPYTYGNERDIIPDMDGTWTVGVRQDNMGLPAATYGTRTTPPLHPYFERYCCVIPPRDPGEKMVNNVSVYPNPASDRFTIDFDLAAQSTIDVSIYDLYGNVRITIAGGSLMDAGHHSLGSDVSRLEIGSYFVIIKAMDEVSKIPITVAR